jgi:iron complex outermembrane recepter protein
LGAIVDVAANRYFAKAPRTSATVGADITLFDNEKWGKLTLGGDVQYQSKTFSLPGQRLYDPRFALVATGAELAIPSSTVANARLRLDDIALNDSGLNAYVMLWVNNLTNYRKVNNKIAFGPNFGGLIVANYHEPLTAGITVGFKLR